MQGLNIFGDHSDVMAARATGFALFSSKSVQEAMDFSLIAQAATLESRYRFYTFSTASESHEVQKIEELTMDDMRAMIPETRSLATADGVSRPARPPGYVQEPGCLLPGEGNRQPFLRGCSRYSQKAMDKFAGLVGRQYRLFGLLWGPGGGTRDRDHGSAGDAVAKTVDVLKDGERRSGCQVRLYRVLREGLPRGRSPNRQGARCARPHQGARSDR